MRDNGVPRRVRAAAAARGRVGPRRPAREPALAIRLIDVLIKAVKGVAVVPEHAAWTGPWLSATRTPSLQRVANRPIVCHVLDTLLTAGIVEVAVVAPSDVTAEIAECISREGPAGVTVHNLVADRLGEGDAALLAAAEFVGDDPCVLHRADGLLGQPLLPYVELRDREECWMRCCSSSRWVRCSATGVGAPGIAPSPLGPDSPLASPGFAGVCLLGAGRAGASGESAVHRTAA